MFVSAIFRQPLFAAFFVGQVFFTASAPVLAQSGVDGRNVTVIEYGRKLGELRQTGPGQWAETNAAGQVAFRFEETKRDESAVWLLDRSRNVTLQIDLKTRKIMYSAGGSPASELYSVLTAAATPAAPSAAGASVATALCQFNTGMHTITFDNEQFDNVALGVHFLVDSDALTVQVRRDVDYPANRLIKLVSAIAIRAGSTTYVFDQTGPALKSVASTGVTVSTTGKPGTTAKFQMQDGSLVSIADVLSSGLVHYNVNVSVPASAKGKIRGGICGNFDGDARNDYPGAQTNVPATWVVPDNRNLFK